MKTHSPPPAEQRLLGNSPAICRLRAQIDKLAPSLAPVYISGESGSGKERVARLIHAQGPRASQPFVAINCGAIPSELMESEFFGHRKGSFSGAIEDKPGLFQAASGGTLLLDEVADLPLPMQVKLLRVLQEKTIRCVGALQESVVDVRILCATHKDLGAEVAAGRFRQDLYYRLNVIELRVPPLRERQGDLELLANHVLKRLAAQSNVPTACLQAQALEALKQYHFPGNVRELENILERAHIFCEQQRIGIADLGLAGGDRRDLNPPPRPKQVDNLEHYLESVERQVILQALEETRWNRTAAAHRLNVSLRSLRYRLRKFALD